MKQFAIYNYKNQDILFKGMFQNFKSCVETAISENVNLAHADFRHQDLTNIMLDDAVLSETNFTGSNLTGANLSESSLRSCIFENTALFNTCFAYSDLQSSNFRGASFGGTDITGTNISFSAFSTLSWTNLDFTQARLMKDCTFQIDDCTRTLSYPPIVIKGLTRKPFVLMKDVLCHGNEKIEYDRMRTWVKRLLYTSKASDKKVA